MKKIFITGATRGIGFQAICALANTPNVIPIMGYRTTQSLNEARQELKRRGLPQVKEVACDVSDLSSIDKAKKQIKDKFQNIDILVNNAAVTPSAQTYQQAVRVFQTNYFGLKYLTQNLLELVNLNGKIIAVSSSLFKPQNSLTNPDLRQKLMACSEIQLVQHANQYLSLWKQGKDINGAGYVNKSMLGFHIYNVSKLYVNLYYRKLFQRIRTKNNIGIYTLTPGFCKTGLTKMSGNRSASQGGQCIVRQVMREDKNFKLSGSYFNQKGDAEPII